MVSALLNLCLSEDTKLSFWLSVSDDVKEIPRAAVEVTSEIEQ